MFGGQNKINNKNKQKSNTCNTETQRHVIWME